MTRTAITNGTIVSATGRTAGTVVVDGQKISAVLMPGSDDERACLRGDTKVIDATGRYVIPGGIDVHTHMQLPSMGTVASDSFETGTIAAAWGGTTTILDFPTQDIGSTLGDALERWSGWAQGNCAIDYGFHMIMTDVNAASLKEMEAMHDAGITSFKLFTAYPGALYSTDAQIFRAMQKGAELGSIVMIHAENGIVMDELRKDMLAAGRTDPVYHSLSRPEAMEAEATNRVIQIAKVAGCAVYIVHLSAAEALEPVMVARDRGQKVFAETCPQYLYRTIDDLRRDGLDGFEGANFVCSCPLRDESNHAALWRGLRQNDLSIVSTDHCPFNFDPQKLVGRGDFTKIPNGMAGVEHRVDLVHQAVHEGKLSVERWVEICATTPARLFGLYGRKGVIAPGADADIVIYDPNAVQTLSAATHHMNVDYSPYEGEVVHGWAETVMSRGSLVIDRRRYVGSTRHGVYLKRGLSSYS